MQVIQRRELVARPDSGLQGFFGYRARTTWCCEESPQALGSQEVMRKHKGPFCATEINLRPRVLSEASPTPDDKPRRSAGGSAATSTSAFLLSVVSPLEPLAAVHPFGG